jgi:porin
MTTIPLIPIRNRLLILLLDATAALGLMICGSGALAQTPLNPAQDPTAQSEIHYPEDPNDEDQIDMPGEVKADIKESFAQPGAIFPNLVFPGRQAYEKFKVDLNERYGLRFGINYQMLYQYASSTAPGATYNSALGGWAAAEALWTPLYRGGPYEGSLVIRLGWRDSLGNNAVPAQFGAPQLGSLWSNYEFTSWGSKVAIEDLFWEQFLTRRLRLRLGNQIPTAVFNFSRFKDARVSFTSSPFAFHETIPYPTFGLGVSARWLPIQDSELYVDATLIDMNGDPNDYGLDWSTFSKGQYFYGTEIGYRWRRPNGEFDHLHLDLFYAAKRSSRNPTTTPNSAGGGFRVYGEKQLGRFVAFGGETYNTAKGGGISATLAQQVATGGIAYLNPLNVRGEAAFGFMWSQPIKNILPIPGRNQFGYETYWRLQVAPNITVTPGLQIVFNPSFNPAENLVAIPSIKFRMVF